MALTHAQMDTIEANRSAALERRAEIRADNTLPIHESSNIEADAPVQTANVEQSDISPMSSATEEEQLSMAADIVAEQ